ncbi:MULTISPECIES: HI1506-related protein [unclassified Desulfovibrio]|uniref:HI1506-related protein n=1 Tax=unclassified Desulfovibrio TaxID=2593640 RepID=UPI0013EDF3FD|nr:MULTISPECIES: HI1506-related protein [unclassified Desulfovibrio]
MRIHVKARPPLARRCRCGYCFDAEGQELVVSERELAALTADPKLVVTVLEAPEAQPDPEGEAA